MCISGESETIVPLKKSWRADLSRSEAVGAAVLALTDAADEDRATGGVDLQRRIFPIVKLASGAGIEDIPEAEVEEVYRGILARRDNGGATS